MTKSTKVFTGDGDVKTSPVNSWRPVREPSTRSDVDVPLKAASGAMVFIFLLFFGIMLYTGKPLTRSMLGLGIIICSIVGIGVFFLMMRWSASVVWAIEKVAQVDINNDHTIGEPSRLVPINRNGNNNRYDPTTEWQKGFYEYIKHLYSPDGLSHHGARKKFSEQQIMKYRDYALRLGVIKWKNEKNHQNGIELVVSDLSEAEGLADKAMWIESRR